MDLQQRRIPNMPAYTPTRHYRKDSVIFREGDEADGVYYICAGEVEINVSQGGEKLVLAALGEGSIFGEMAVIDGKPRSATAIARTDVWCYVVNKQTFAHKMEQLEPIMQGLFRILTNSLRHMNDKVKQIESER